MKTIEQLFAELKEKAAKESARYMAELASKNREHKSVQDRLDTEDRKKDTYKCVHKCLSHLENQVISLVNQ